MQKELQDILDSTKEHAQEEMRSWLSLCASLDACNVWNIPNVKHALFILSNATKAVRRYGQLTGLDEQKD